MNWYSPAPPHPLPASSSTARCLHKELHNSTHVFWRLLRKFIKHAANVFSVPRRHGARGERCLESSSILGKAVHFVLKACILFDHGPSFMRNPVPMSGKTEAPVQRGSQEWDVGVGGIPPPPPPVECSTSWQSPDSASFDQFSMRILAAAQRQIASTRETRSLQPSSDGAWGNCLFV